MCVSFLFLSFFSARCVYCLSIPSSERERERESFAQGLFYGARARVPSFLERVVVAAVVAFVAFVAALSGGTEPTVGDCFLRGRERGNGQRR